jgi:hypothetical protein
LFAEYVRLLGEVHLRAARGPAACASFRRSQALLIGLSAKGISDSSDLAARIRNQMDNLKVDLVACGPPVEPAEDTRKP